jgi:CHAT domain-containing protein
MRTSVDISGAERLFIADILRLPLKGTAVFSGCETASGGSLSDSECITLAAAALNAGCRSAVGSLWCAGDVCSAPIIEDFFAHLRRDPSRASLALWSARRAARQREVEQAERERRVEEVHAWATFVAYGM